LVRSTIIFNTNSQLHYLECNVFDGCGHDGRHRGVKQHLIVEFAHRLIEDDAPRGGTICCPGSSSPDFNDFASNDYRTLRILVLLLVVARSAPAEIYHHPGTAARRVKNRISIPDRLTLDQAESIALQQAPSVAAANRHQYPGVKFQQRYQMRHRNFAQRGPLPAGRVCSL
jgi:hypothetical protein